MKILKFLFVIGFILIIYFAASYHFGYRVKARIDTFKDENIFDEPCVGEVKYDILYSVHIYKGMSVIKNIGSGGRLHICEHEYDSILKKVKERVRILKKDGDK